MVIRRIIGNEAKDSKVVGGVFKYHFPKCSVREPVRQEVNDLKEQDSRWKMNKHMFKQKLEFLFKQREKCALVRVRANRKKAYDKFLIVTYIHRP